MSFDPLQIALPHVAQLHGYTPGLQPSGEGWIKLNTNENPYPPSPRVGAALAACAVESLRLYPEPRSLALRQAIARHHCLSETQVLIGNGSDEVLALLARAFCGQNAPLACTDPSYSLYPVLADTVGAPILRIEFDRGFSLPVARCAAVDAPIFFLTSPNAPSGVGFPRASIAALARGFRGLLVVDEAYAAFAEEDAVGLVNELPNVCCVRTFSKSHALAGIRCGYLLARPEVVSLLDRLRDSYNLDRLAQAAALAAIGDTGYYDAIVGKIRRTREYFIEALNRLGWSTYPSQTNFVLTEPRTRDGRHGLEVATDLYEFLLSRRILVRHFPKHPLTASHLRITIGDDVQMVTLQETLEAWLNKE